MSTWVGMGPVIGPGSLDGFAIGVMMSGACFLAVMAPRRARAGRRPRRAPRHADGGARVAVQASQGAQDLQGAPGSPGFPRCPRSPGFPRCPGPGLSTRVCSSPVRSRRRVRAGPLGRDRSRVPSGWRPASREPDRRRLCPAGRRSRPGRARSPEQAPARRVAPRAGVAGRAPGGGTSRDACPRGGVALARRPRSSDGFPDSAFPDSAFPDVRPGQRVPGQCALRSMRRPRPRAPAAGADSPKARLRAADPGHGTAGHAKPAPERPPARCATAGAGATLPDWASRDEAPFPKTASRDAGGRTWNSPTSSSPTARSGRRSGPSLVGFPACGARGRPGQQGEPPDDRPVRQAAASGARG